MNIIAPILTTLTLALVAASPAAAGVTPDLPRPGDAEYAVPVGKVEHTVTVTEVTGTKAVPSHMRQELWLSRHRARSVSTDVETGKVTAEIVVVGRETRMYTADTGRVTIQRTGRPSIPFTSSRFEAAVQRAYVEQGITKATGETTVRGRRALVVESVPGKWRSDEPDSKTVAVVDAETYALYARTTTLPAGAFTQKETYETSTLGGGSPQVRFVMGRHTGAKPGRIVRGHAWQGTSTPQ